MVLSDADFHVTVTGNLCVVAFVRNEEDGIREWVRYYLNNGFDHVFIFADRCTDGTVKQVEDLVLAKQVTVTPFSFLEVREKGNGELWVPWNPVNIALRVLKTKFKWAAFFDSDEFLRCTTPGRTIADVLKDYADCGGVSVYWRMFGSSLFQTKEADRNVLNSYVLRAPDAQGQFCKTVVNLDKFCGCFRVCGHVPIANPNTPSIVDLNRNTIHCSWGPAVYAPLVLHHYVCKSWKYWIQEKIPKGKEIVSRHGKDTEKTHYRKEVWFGELEPRNHSVLDLSLADGTAKPTPLRIVPNVHGQEYRATLQEWADDGFPEARLVATANPVCPDTYRMLLKKLCESDQFDFEWYERVFPDTREMGGFRHFWLHGIKEGRPRNQLCAEMRSEGNFDRAFYLEQNPDVKAAGFDPLLHYLLHGKKEGRAKNRTELGTMGAK